MSAGGRVVVGVDGGGSKTHAVVADCEGRVLGFGEAGPSNWELVGIASMTTSVSEAVDLALAEAGVSKEQVVAAIYALAGCDWPSDEQLLTEALGAIALGGQRTVVNDALATLHAGARDGHGIASVAGTGGSTTGQNRSGQAFRTFAVSIGEASGASGIARASLDSVAREYHGQIGPTLLTPRLLAASEYASVPELFEAISRGNARGLSAKLAPVVFAAANDGDTCAQEIATAAGASHARDAIGVAHRLNMVTDAFPVVCSGGVHTAGNVAFDGAFREAIAVQLANATVETLTYPPVLGAVVMALAAVVVPTRAIRNHLETALSEIR